MEHIFHEKQEGSLCAQHCLNALLQGAYFTAVDLGTLAQSLDDEERSRMAESGLESEEYRRFLAQPSGNMDDSGYFSVQVISRALQVWGLDLLPYSSTAQEALIAQQCPAAMTAFICNYRDHWFTIRKLGSQWFNLNSLLSRPQLISDTYLAMFLAQLQQEGYSIFVVRGSLPDCPADAALTVCPYVPPSKREPVATTASRDLARSVSGSDDEDLKAALALSLAEQDTTQASAGLPLSRGVSSEEEELQAALALSLGVKDGEDAARGGEPSEESELDKALRLSMECCDTKDARPADPDEVRRKRLAFLDSTKS